MSSTGSEPDGYVVDVRKRKRMISNRESARRSRQRKQQHLDNLTAQIAQLRNQNRQISGSISNTAQQYLSIEAENSILRAQVDELSNYFHSLNEIVRCLTTTTTTSAATTATAATATATAAMTATTTSDESEEFGGFDLEIDDGFSMDSWGFGFPFGGNNSHCSVVPTIDAFMC